MLLFLAPSIVGVIFLGLAVAPLGCVLLWRRLSFFSDGLSHACVLGVAFSLLFHLPFLVGVILIALCMGILLLLYQRLSILTLDTFFTVLSYTFFAGGLISLSLQKKSSVPLDDILFGDFLSLNWSDALISIFLFLSVFAFFKFFWKKLVYACLSPDLYRVHFFNNNLFQGLFILLCAVCVAVGMYFMGAVLLPALVIFPAACARLVAQSPLSMIIKACLISILSCIFGLLGAFFWDSPPSPMIVIAFAFFFCMILGYSLLKKIIHYKMA